MLFFYYNLFISITILNLVIFICSLWKHTLEIISMLSSCYCSMIFVVRPFHDI